MSRKPRFETEARKAKRKSKSSMAASNTHCCVPMCVSVKKKNRELSFHTFPKEKMLRKLWLVRIKRDEGPLFKVNRHTKVCSAHFTKDDYIWKPVRPKLKPDAAPSIFAWTSETKQTGRRNPKGRYTLSPKKGFDINIDRKQVDEEVATQSVDEVLDLSLKRPADGSQRASTEGEPTGENTTDIGEHSDQPQAAEKEHITKLKSRIQELERALKQKEQELSMFQMKQFGGTG